MDDRTITLPSDLVERLEMLAERQGRSLEEMFGELLNSYAPLAQGSWALSVSEGMSAAAIAWIDDPDASKNSREHFERSLRSAWERTQHDSQDNLDG
jgi:predicted transcriptional regulator